MVQEMITFIIIGAAVTIAVMKITRKFSTKKPTGLQNSKGNDKHVCADCSADCLLRDAINQAGTPNNASLCKKIEKESK